MIHNRPSFTRRGSQARTLIDIYIGKHCSAKEEKLLPLVKEAQVGFGNSEYLETK